MTQVARVLCMQSERLELLVSASSRNNWTISPYFTADGSKNIALDISYQVSLITTDRPTLLFRWR